MFILDNYYWLIFLLSIILIYSIISIVHFYQLGLIEKLGKYVRYANSSFQSIIPRFKKKVIINITERMIYDDPHEIIINDRFVSKMDVLVYFYIKNDNGNFKKTNNKINRYFEWLIVILVRKILINMIRSKNLETINSEKRRINTELFKILSNETLCKGISIIRTEFKEINLLKNINEKRNKVSKIRDQNTIDVDFSIDNYKNNIGIQQNNNKQIDKVENLDNRNFIRVDFDSVLKTDFN